MTINDHRLILDYIRLILKTFQHYLRFENAVQMLGKCMTHKYSVDIYKKTYAFKFEV